MCAQNELNKAEGDFPRIIYPWFQISAYGKMLKCKFKPFY